MRAQRRAVLAVGLAVAAFTAGAPRAARADGASTSACIDAYEQAQRLMQGGKLRAARDKLLVCSRESCPKVSQNDCAGWLRDVARDMPSIVIVAQDGHGHDLADVRVSVDGEIVAERLDGRALPLDPGSHDLKLEARGRRLEQKLLVRSGEQNRRVLVDFPDDAAPSTGAVGAPATVAGPKAATSAAPPEHGEALPTSVWVLGGVSVAALASFTAFAIVGKNQEGCVPGCTASEVSDFRRSYVIADISLGIGVVAAGAALWIALTRR
ncbi:MAG: hypothetical protein JST00_04640 [Deltaproteobacteria bacterium]|nr:hypothetical protein [Deltaproteobacteria bacterium]